MPDRIKVAVSPFYGGEDWTDERTGIKFEKGDQAVRVYSIPASADLTNIKKAIRLNALIPVEGQFEALNETEEVKVEAKPKEEVKAEVKEEKKEAPKESEAKEEVKAEAKEEKAEEKPKAKSTKKKSTKSKSTK